MIYESISDEEVVKTIVDDGQVENYISPLDEGEGKEEELPRRAVALFFTDESDAQSMVNEMKQMGTGMKNADIRITATNMARALRQSTVLGKGLSTGGLTAMGKTDGQLRYKIVPSSRELYYASKCDGKQRLGFSEDMITEPPRWTSSLVGDRAEMLEMEALIKGNKSKKEQEEEEKMNEKYAAYDHMKGKTGVPVFYAEGMRHLKGIPGRKKAEVPMFFSYEDLLESWGHMRKKTLEGSMDADIPEVPKVEVYNYLDIITSIDKIQQRSEKVAWKDRLNLKKSAPTLTELESVNFIPSSRSVTYKETLSAVGNGKSRLRPMR